MQVVRICTDAAQKGWNKKMKEQPLTHSSTAKQEEKQEERGAHAKHYACLLYLNLDSVLEGDKYYEN